MPYRRSISNIPNCEPLREIKVAEVDCLGLYQLGIKLKGRNRKWVFSQDYQILDVCFTHQYLKKEEDNKF